MKFAIVLFCLIPLVFGQLLNSILDTAELRSLVDAVVEKFGTDATEKQCETECTQIFKSDVLDKGCDFACLGIQDLIKKLHSK